MNIQHTCSKRLVNNCIQLFSRIHTKKARVDCGKHQSKQFFVISALNLIENLTYSHPAAHTSHTQLQHPPSINTSCLNSSHPLSPLCARWFSSPSHGAHHYTQRKLPFHFLFHSWKQFVSRLSPPAFPACQVSWFPGPVKLQSIYCQNRQNKDSGFTILLRI